MSDHKLPFWVKMADPSRTFYDPTTSLYICQDQRALVEVMTPRIKDALGQGGLVKCSAPEYLDETEQELTAPPSDPNAGAETQQTSTQETSETTPPADEHQEEETTQEEQSETQEPAGVEKVNSEVEQEEDDATVGNLLRKITGGKPAPSKSAKR